jgi:hypothetical protein
MNGEFLVVAGDCGDIALNGEITLFMISKTTA